MRVRHVTPTGKVTGDNWNADHIIEGFDGQAAGLYSEMSDMAHTGDVVTTTGYTQGGIGGARYIYDASLNALNVASGGNAGTAFLSTNGRGYRLDPNQVLTFDMFGGIPGDYTTGATGFSDAAYARFQAWATQYRRNVSVSYSAGVPPLYFTGAYYKFAAEISVKSGVQLHGYGMGTEGVEPSWLHFVNDTAGIHVEWDDSDDSAYGTFIGGFTIQGARTTPSGTLTTDLLKSGIRCNARTYVQDTLVRNFTGAGILLSAVNGAPGEFNGNINGMVVERCSVRGCYSGGVFISGGDANVIKLDSVDVALCGRYGFWVSPFLSTVLINCQADHCGIPSFSELSEYAIVHYGGALYQARYNATTATLKATTPGTDETVWMRLGAGTASTDWPTWNGTGNYVPGGVYGGTGAFTTLVACYHETGTTIPDLPGAISVGGFMGSGAGPTPQLNAGTTCLASNKGFRQAKTFADGSSAYVQAGGDMPSSGWHDLAVWNSTAATPGNTGAEARLQHHKTTGDVAVSLYGTATPISISGASTTRTFGGRSQAESYAITQIPSLKVGPLDEGGVQTRGSAAPTTGYHGKGDIVWNDGTVTGIGTTLLWVCTAAGTPGTWASK